MHPLKLVLLALFVYILLPLNALLAASPMNVTVSIVPQAYFVQQIAGDLAEVSVMVLPGASPANYEPKPNQMKALSASTVYFAVGVPFETTWLDKIHAANPDMTVIATQDGVTKVPMARHLHDPADKHAKGHHGHDHGHGASTILDPHIWLAPDLVKIQAQNICKGLVAADPAHRATYEKNLEAFEKRLAHMDASIRTILGDTSTRNRFLVFHPAWGYFAEAYGLEQIPVEIEGKSPSPRELGSLIKLARTYRINTVFVQPQFSQKSATVIAGAIDGKVVRLDPLAEDWTTNLEKATRAIKEALR